MCRIKEGKQKSVPKPYEISKYDGTSGAKTMVLAKASTELQFVPCFGDAGYWNKMVVQPLSMVTTPEPCPGPIESESQDDQNQQDLFKGNVFFF